MVDDVTPHQMYKQVSGVTLGFQSTPGSSATLFGTGWSTINNTTPSPITTYWINRQYIDLSGWTRKELTLFTRGVDIQKQAMPLSNAGNTARGLYEMDVLTTRRLSDEECEIYATSIVGGTGGPGFLPSTMDLMEVIYGEIAEYSQNLQIPGSYIRTNGETFGSGNPVAVDKLHWTRIYYAVLPGDGDAFVIHPTNLVVQATTAHESDLVWIERLRRSYTQQRSET